MNNDGTDLEKEKAIAARNKIAEFYRRKRRRESLQVHGVQEGESESQVADSIDSGSEAG